MEVKKRKIRQKDWDELQTFVKKELDSRRSADFRKHHETIWKEVDRQIKMEPMKRVNEAGQQMPPSWNSAFELGELSKASEIIAADVMRIMFPEDWFVAHCELEKQFDEQGNPVSDPTLQDKVDGLLRSLMVQQQEDFGFKERFEMSVKEALHHGSFVAEVQWDSEMQVMDGDKVKTIAAPTWIPHSMWNCYPDPSPRVIGTNLFYTGSMIITSYMPMHKLKRMSGEGWMQSQFDKIPKDSKKDSKDVELATFYGDAVIPRADGEDIYLPNVKIILANGTIVYYKENELPYPSVIHGGYEKQDVRDPYYISPIIKQSPIQKLTTIIANKFVDAISLKVEPPTFYNGNDPQLIASGGPVIAPGVSTPTRGPSEIVPLDIGDPTWAMQGLEMGLRQLQEGTGVSAIRSAVPSADRQTATEVNKTEQAAEVRTVDFISKLNSKVNTFLYMQHAMNVKYLKEYTFYNNDVNSPDFIRVTRKDINEVKTAHFDVVGAKGVLGEDKRMERTAAVTAFLSTNPLFSGLLKPSEIALDAYKNAGNKNPERFVNAQDQMQQAQQMAEQMAQEQTAQMQEEMAKMQEELAKAKMNEQAKIIEAQAKAEQMQAETAMKQQEMVWSHEAEMEKIRLAHEAKLLEIAASHEAQMESAEMQAKASSQEKEAKVSVNINDEEHTNKVVSDIAGKLESAMENVHNKIGDTLDKLQKGTAKPKKQRISTPSGKVYVVEND